MKENQKTRAPHTTQRVDLDTLNRIKTVDLHLSRRGVRLSQSKIIGKAVSFAMCKEAEFMEYVVTEKLNSPESTFDMIVSIAGKPWFPYGNLV
jgi:hypothetical protein